MARNIFYPGSIQDDFRSRGLMSVKEFMNWADMSRWKFYDLAKKKKLRPRKVDGRTVVPIEEAERWLRDLPEYEAKGERE